MRSAFSASPLVRRARAELGRRFSQSDLARQSARLEKLFRAALARKPEVVLISTYLMYREIVERLCALCHEAGVPTIVGGPYFTDLRVREAWRRMPTRWRAARRSPHSWNPRRGRGRVPLRRCRRGTGPSAAGTRLQVSVL
jgi:hypothetical protein